MGNPISPILSDIVMEDLESYCISKLQSKPLFYLRYVDDIMLCIHENNIDDTLKTFKSYDTNLQFTVERSNNNSISFLDIEIIINEQRNIITNWYKKQTFSRRYLNYNSHHLVSNKIAIIYCLVDKAIKLSHNNFREINISIKLLLKNNDYPLNICLGAR